MLKVPAQGVSMATRWQLCVCGLGVLLLVSCSLSGDIFPHVNPWLAELWVALILIGAGGCAVLAYADVQRKAYESERDKLHQKIGSQEKENKQLKSEHDKLRKTIGSQEEEKKRLKSERDQLHQKTGSQEEEKKRLKSECQQLRETLESQKNENKKLESACQELHDNLESQENENKKLKSECQQLRVNLESQKNENKKLESECQQLCENLESQENENKKWESAFLELQEFLESQKNENKKLESACQELRDNLESQRHENKELKSECQQLHETLECDKLRETVESQENEKKQWTSECDKLQERVDGLQIELKWRRAHSYADDITLNADTAHPSLSIARDKKSVKHEAQPQKVPPNPERFDSTVCVLGSEGFSSGNHYWEVDIGSSTDWDLGVAVKYIKRKGKLSLSPKEGIWALNQSGKDYWAKTDPWTRVIVQKKPKKIGIYLCYREKQVTFFNVTDMSVLFTFNDCSFSGEVYPFFKNSHKETTMRISSIKDE